MEFRQSINVSLIESSIIRHGFENNQGPFFPKLTFYTALTLVGLKNKLKGKRRIKVVI